jgi:hypothetical protein
MLPGTPLGAKARSSSTWRERPASIATRKIFNSMRTLHLLDQNLGSNALSTLIGIEFVQLAGELRGILEMGREECVGAEVSEPVNLNQQVDRAVVIHTKHLGLPFLFGPSMVPEGAQDLVR